MRIDVVDIGRRDARPLQRSAHASEGAVAVLGRRSDVIGVAGEAIADDFGIDLRAARFGVLEFFDNHDTCALAHDKTVAILVIRA